MLLVAEIALDALAVLSSGIAHKKQKPHDNFSVWFYRGCRKGQVTVNIVPFFFLYLNTCLGVVSCVDWVFETNVQCLSCNI